MSITYLDKHGGILQKGQGRLAHYKIEGSTKEALTLLERKNREWSLVLAGTSKDIEKFFLPEKHPHAHIMAERVFERVSYLPGIDALQVQNYLLMVLWRNRHADQSRVINTRLVDRIGQPIHILYTGDFSGNFALSEVYVVDSIAQAVAIYPELTQPTLLSPIQWSSNLADYIWDSRLEVLKISDATYEHIFRSRRYRFDKEHAAIDPSTLLRSVREAMSSGQQRAARDCSFALPSYSSRRDSINMMLPLHIFTGDGELPESVLLLGRTEHGYSLMTILTPQQAYVGVRAFRDPESTWLKGAF